MVLGRVVTACAALAVLTSASAARGGDAFAIDRARGQDGVSGSASEPAIASAHAGAQAVAEFHSCPGDGLAVAAARGAVESAPGSRTGALFRSMLVPGYGQLYNGQRLKGGLLFGVELALLSTALAFHLAGDSVLSAYNQQARAQVSADPTGRIQRLYDGAQARYRVRDELLMAATGLWVLNIADAYLSGGRARPLLGAGAARSGRDFAPLAAIRPGRAIFGLQGRF
jgi:TM2 domain-containing membrane protein YozV